jgi:hypothetical protein
VTPLHVIHADGAVESKNYAGELEYACPKLSDMRAVIGCATVEHVSVLWLGRESHMFVDEDGRAKGLARNERATRVYYNNTLERGGRPELVYDDLSADAPPLLLFERGLEDPGFYIVGTALLWEGGME